MNENKVQNINKSPEQGNQIDVLISIDKFTQTIIDDVNRFKKYWMENHIINSEIFPINMQIGEWDEQFRIFE